MTTKLLPLCIFTAILFLAAAAPACAQHETSTGISVDQDLDLLRRDIRAEKKKIIALNVPMTTDEATRFWPVYDAYAGDMTKHYDEFYSVIKDYAANQKSLSDTQAVSMVKRWSDVQVKLAQTRQRYVPLVEKVLPGKKAALFFQIDRRLYALMDLQVASNVPLVLQ